MVKLSAPWFLWLAVLCSLLLPLSRLPGQTGPLRLNLAKYQATTASGQTGFYEPSFAVDGLVSNFNSFRTNNTNNPQWLEVSFPRPVAVGSAHLYLGRDNDPAKGGLPSFKFQSHDGTGWVDVPGSAVTGNTATEREVRFATPVTSNRFRLYTDENGSLTIRELALFPPHLAGAVEQGYPIGTDVHLNLAYQRSTVGSSIYNNGFPKLATDGYVDDTSRWLCTGTPSGQTLEIDLLESSVVGSAHLYSGYQTGGALDGFRLEYWSGSAWLTIPGATISGNTSATLAIPFSSDITTSRVRLVTTTANFGRVRELLFFPPRAGGYLLGQDVVVTPPPTVAWDYFSDSSWKLKNGGPDLRLGLVNGSVVFANGASPASQIDWQLLLNHRDGSFRLRHPATGGCLAQGEISLATGKPVVVETYSGLPHQNWFLEYANASQFRLINAYSGLALSSNFSQWAVGTGMVVTTRDVAAPLQLWQRIYSTHHPKKGVADVGSRLEDSYNKLNGSWCYTWGRMKQDTFPFFPFTHTPNPMQWSGNAVGLHTDPQGPEDRFRSDLQSAAKPVHVMGFNEPDHTDQANMTVATALARWAQLEALDMPLVAPCPANPTGTWADDWNTQANALGLRRDYTPVHWYANPNSDSLISTLQNVYNTYGRPVWLTEFAPISWSGADSWTKADNFNLLAEFMWRAEALTWLKRYSYFQFSEGGAGGTDTPAAPRGNMRKSDGSLTALGELYSGWDGVTSVVTSKPYHVHNRQAYTRLMNPGGTASLSFADPDLPTTGTLWTLTSGLTAGTHRIVSAVDGRNLRFYEGVSVGLAPSTTTTPQVDWRLVADQHGWYFVEHPSTNKRLRDTGNGAFAMGPITGGDSSYKWRFVVPATLLNSAPVLADISAKTVNENALLAFTATAADADLPATPLTFSLIGAPAGAALDSATGAFTWTPTEAQGPGSFSFTVRVSDGTLTDEQAVTVTVNEVNTAPVLASIPSQSVNLDATLTFTAAATDADLPANTLTYSLLGAPVGAALDPATGVFTWTPTLAQGAGSYTFTVRVSDGSLTHDSPVSVTVSKVPQAVSFASLPVKNSGDAPFSLSATASSGLAVSYASSNPAVATISGSTVTIIGVGSATITASQAGDTYWSPAPAVGQTLTVAPVGTSSAWIVDASGNWSGTTNWLNAIVPNAADATAYFTANLTVARTVTLDSNRTAGNISFTDSSLSSHDLTLSGSGTLTLDTSASLPNISVTQSGRVLTLAAVLAGNKGLQKDGPGTLVLNALNTFTGGITLDGGAFQSAVSGVGDSRALNGNSVTFAASTSFRVFNSTSANTTMAGGIQVNPGVTATFVLPASTWGFASDGVLSGSGTVTVSGTSASGVVLNFLNTANTFTGTFANPAGGSTGGGFNVASLVDGPGLIRMGSGTFSLATTNPAPVVLSQRRIELLGATSGTTVSNNASNALNSLTINTDLLVTGVGGKAFGLGGANTGANTFAGNISDGPGSVIGLTKSGAGSWKLSGAANAYTGVTNLSAGTLEVVKLADGGLPSGIGASGNAPANLLLGSGVTLRYTGTGDSTDRAITYSANANNTGFNLESSGSGAVSFTNPSALVNSTTNQGRYFALGGTNAGDNTLAAQINNNGTSTDNTNVSKIGTGKWVLTNVNSSYTGGTFINGGILGAAVLANSGANSPFGAGTVIGLGRGNDSGTLLYTGSGHFTNRAVRLGTPNSVPGTGGGFLLNDGTGPLTFTAATFNTAVTGLTGSAGSQNRTLTLGGAYTLGINEIQGAITNNTASTGLVGVMKTGPATWKLSGGSTYTGGTTVQDGFLVAGSNTAFGTGAVSVTGGSLDLGGRTLANSVTIAAGGSLTGSGTLSSAATIQGALAPGGAAPGLVTLASATVGPAASFVFELSGTGTRGTAYDALTVNSALALDGTVTVTLNGLVPAAGQSFDLINSTGAINVATFNVATDLVLPALAPTLAWDTSAFAASGVISIVVGGPSFTSFASANFSPAEQADPLVSGPAADPDQDGVSNVLEYAFAMSPSVPSVANLPRTVTVPVSADTFVGVTYTRLKGATDLVFTPEFSSVPESAGYTASASLQISLVDNGNGTETVTLRDTTPVTASAPRFVRLRVLQN